MKNRYAHIDIMRIVACFFVIFNHTGYNGYYIFSNYEANSIQYWLYMFISVFCKFAVPTFFAISGALLLQKDESIRDLYSKRVVRMIIVTIGFSFAYYLLNMRFQLYNISVRHFLGTIYHSNIIVPFWFLYAYIAFLVSLPLLRPMVKNMSNKNFLYLFIIAIVFKCILPLLEYLQWKGAYHYNASFSIDWLLSDIVIFPCLGYYLENRMDSERARKYIPSLWLVNVITIIISCLMTYYKTKVIGDCNNIGDSESFFKTFRIINMITIYATCKCLVVKPISSRLSSIITSVATSVFGIYLIHLAVMRLCNKFHVYNLILQTFGLNDMIASFLYCTVILVFSYVIILVINKIPLFRKLL